MLAPIILFAYNRPEHVRKTLVWLGENELADQSVLYVYCDGPKPDASTEQIEKAIGYAKERALEKGREEDDWNHGGWPLNRGREISASSITNAYDLYDIIKEYGPVYGYYYDKDNKDAHMIVITGVIPETNTVFTNNPWGFKAVQQFDSFIKHVSRRRGSSHDNMVLYSIYIPYWGRLT